jgi:hypothetical protein
MELPPAQTFLFRRLALTLQKSQTRTGANFYRDIPEMDKVLSRIRSISPSEIERFSPLQLERRLVQGSELEAMSDGGSRLPSWHIQRCARSIDCQRDSGELCDLGKAFHSPHISRARNETVPIGLRRPDTTSMFRSFDSKFQAMAGVLFTPLQSETFASPKQSRGHHESD